VRRSLLTIALPFGLALHAAAQNPPARVSPPAAAGVSAGALESRDVEILARIGIDTDTIDQVDRDSLPDGEVIRFHVPGAPTRSTITRRDGLTAVTLVTAEASYRLRPSASDAAVFVLEPALEAGVKTPVLENDTMTPFEAAVRTGNFSLLATESLATGAPGRPRISYPSSEIVEHRNIAIYTSRFAAHYGSADKVRLAIQHLFDVRDTALRDSAVPGIRDVLVYAEERNESTWLAAEQSLDTLVAFGADVRVRDLRVKFQANAGYWDHNPSTAAGGVAMIFEGQPASPVCGTYVIQWHQDGLDRTVAHELGHVGGAEHNKANASAYACPYCFGWYNNYLRDIMAVACGDVDCHEIALYSNTTTAFKADFWDYHATVVLGSAEENTARRLSETRHDVRDFWKSIPR
jgi:hypothetical protein